MCVCLRDVIMYAPPGTATLAGTSPVKSRKGLAYDVIYTCYIVVIFYDACTSTSLNLSLVHT